MNQSEEQVILMTEAMVEAVQHMIELLKVHNITEFNQVLSSYITALKAVQPHIQETKDQSTIQLLNNIQKDISSAVHEIKQDNLDKSIHIFKTTVESNSVKLQEQISEAIKNKKTIIGMYHAENNPSLSYNDNRLVALYEESKKQNCQIYMFESKDVNIQTGKIEARYSLNTKAKKTIDIPDVIYNIFPKINYVHDDVEKWLRMKVPFSTFPINNKVDLPRKINESSDLGHLFLPFIKLTNVDEVFEFLNIHKQGVLKKYAASRGESIYFIEQKLLDEYEVTLRNEINTLNKSEFIHWLEENIIDQKFILQQYKKFKTDDNEPYDIRSHVQKDGTGKWVITKMYPRIGMKDTIISNISRGGRTEDLHIFLNEQFGEAKAIELMGTLEKLSIKVVKAIDNIYNQSIDELGLDLAIDRDGEIWMHEANLKPRMRNHEAERAINTIGYLKYLAKNQLFLTNEVQRI